TVIGDAVNLASRLEQANRLLGTGVLLDARTADAVRGDVLLRPLGRLRLRGRGEPESIYEPLCPMAEATEADRKRAEAARELAEAFARADFPAALAAAAKVEEDPRDRALAGLYRAEIARWQAAAGGGAAATAPAAGTDTSSPSAGEAPRLPAPEGFDATLSLTDSRSLGNAHPK